VKAKKIPKVRGPKAIEEALKAQIISQTEYDLISEAERLRLDAVQVDEFMEAEYLPGVYESGKPAVQPMETGKWAPAKGGGENTMKSGAFKTH